MSLINRYVHAVGTRLPEKSRKDIEKELESLILDALEAKVGAGSKYSEEDVASVLKEFGPPQEVAARYAPSPQYLIGPKLFPIYRLVLGIAIGAAILGLTIAFFVGTFENTGQFVSLFSKLIASLFSAAVSAVGMVTIIFAILERALPDTELEIEPTDEPWDPRKLPPVGGVKDWGSMTKVSVNLAFTIIAMVVFNFYPDKIGIYYQSGADWRFIPILTPAAIKSFLPMWNVVWGLSLVHYSIVIVKREWFLISRVLELVVSLANVAVLLFMATGLQIVDIQSLVINGDLNSIAKLIPIIDKCLRLSFSLIAVVVLIETGVKAYKLIKLQRQESRM